MSKNGRTWTTMNFLQREYDWRGAPLTEAYDELPLWSASPGQLLLEEIPYQGVHTALDIGCGTGFPLLLLARRLGPQAQLIGIDQWEAALARAQAKVQAWGLANVQLLLADAHTLPLPDASVDLITSNLGLNNFADVPKVLAECSRVLRPHGRLCLATNLQGTFAEFYQAFHQATTDLPGIPEQVKSLEAHRPTLDSLLALMNTNGFEAVKTVPATSTMTYASGTAFLNDYFIGMGFLPEWKAIVPESEWESVFGNIENKLNARAAQEGHLRLTIPLAYLELRLATTPV
jgi:arsenite methyltransferase